MQPPSSPQAPASGLRIFLVVALAIATLVTGLFAFFGALGVARGANNSGYLTLAGAFAVLFAGCVIALVGVSIRAPWSRMAAILAGVAVSMTCVGSVLGIPIIVAAAQAQDLGRPRTA